MPAVADSAYNHGVNLADIEHAYRQKLHRFDEDDMVIWLGPARAGDLLELGVGHSGRIVHAMHARAKYTDQLRKPGKKGKRR